MQDKQKVTLYLPPRLHRQLKIRSAIDSESMSAMVEKAVDFYIKNPETVEEVEASHGKTHQVHICPECEAAMVMRDSKMISLKDQPTVVEEEFPLEGMRETANSGTDSQGEEELVPC